MISRYTDRRGLRRYLAGAAAARAGDEMSGPGLLMLGFAVTGRPETPAPPRTVSTGSSRAVPTRPG